MYVCACMRVCEWLGVLLHTRQSFALFRYLFKILRFFCFMQAQTNAIRQMGWQRKPFHFCVP